MAMVIDAHHHLWRYSAAEYGWIDASMGQLRRDFLPTQLHLAMASAGVEGAVAVQARQTVEETRWLLDLAREDAKYLESWDGFRSRLGTSCGAGAVAR